MTSSSSSPATPFETRRRAPRTRCAPWQVAGWVVGDERDGNCVRNHDLRARGHPDGQPARDLHHLVPGHTPLLARPLAPGGVTRPAAAVPNRVRVWPGLSPRPRHGLWRSGWIQLHPVRVSGHRRDGDPLLRDLRRDVDRLGSGVRVSQRGLVAPIDRSAVAIGKALGSTTQAMIQGLILLVLAPLVGVKLSFLTIAEVIPLAALLAFGLSSFGVALASSMKSLQSFQVVMNFLMMPMFFLSGALFPLTNLPGWMTVLTRLDPASYGIDPLRRVVL